MNFYDARRIADVLREAGFEKTRNPAEADILILYTCNVRQKAAQKVFSNIGFLKSENTKIVAVGGCVAQAEKAEIFKCRDVHIVFGPQTYHRLPRHIVDILNERTDRIIDVEFDQKQKFDYLPAQKNVRINEFVTIQEGCDNFCTYCVVPYTRGREYSRSVSSILKEVKNLISNGATEITLLGQNVNSYNGEAPYVGLGASSRTWNFERLLHEVASCPGIRRLRYTTSHPKDFSIGLMKAHAEIPILAPLAHIPLQSGNDRILRMMNRGHTVADYVAKIEAFREICPNIRLSSDFIVGFPTETDAEFQDTLNVIEKIGYVLAYTFKYSIRKNTPAAIMGGQIPEDVKEQRLAALQEVVIKQQKYFNSLLVGKIQEVLFKKQGKKDNQYIGKNAYLQSIVVESNEDLNGTYRTVLVESSAENCAFGRLV